MTNDPLERHLRELSWRKLTHGDQARLRAWLAAHPEAQADWESEAALTEALTQLPDVPVASNFAARVLAAAEREAPDRRRRAPGAVGFWRWLAHGWWPRVALAGLALGAGLLTIHHARLVRLREERAQIQLREERAESLQNVVAAYSIAALPESDRMVLLENFDAIQALNRAPLADDQLLEALK